MWALKNVIAHEHGKPNQKPCFFPFSMLCFSKLAPFVVKNNQLKGSECKFIGLNLYTTNTQGQNKHGNLSNG